jgi:type IV pilus modification protein PilV
MLDHRHSTGEKDLGSRDSQRQEQGFTLVEVMIALFILAFGLLAIATMQATAIKSNSRAMGLTEAANLAQAQMESLIGRPYTDPLLSDTNNDGTNQDADQDGVDDDGGNFGLDTTVGADHTVAWTAPSGGVYTVSWNIAVDEPIRNVKTIRMIVRWPDRGVMRSATFDFMKSQAS